ncbi:hypothetical protein DHEL01_v203321 [Diaporthe helianthi]|uniref:Uncharacterized protein n=1 Tax=Diaporthe helianthi TaxID=158607 RepID=A0A2P5I718_DIAHE|nr:hypothetical protein DHEL01_v203321 [Diaporthe helianthi]
MSEHPLTMYPSLSVLLADPSIDHAGLPIPVEYGKIWSERAHDKRQQQQVSLEKDLDIIQQKLAPAVVEWEKEQGNTYYHPQWRIHDGNAGLVGAKVVPVRLRLNEGEYPNSLASMCAIINNDFAPKRTQPLPSYLIPKHFVRWQRKGPHNGLKRFTPAQNLIWEGKLNPRSTISAQEEELYTRIPKPLEGLSRAASCDHCRIHDRHLGCETVEYFDDRSFVNTIREMSVVETATTPFSLCRFHWWYVWSGELLRRSHVHALEMLLSRDLFERWDVEHMREFLKAVEQQSRDLDACDEVDPEKAQGLVGTVAQNAERPRLPIVPQATVASTEEQPSVPVDQPAVPRINTPRENVTHRTRNQRCSGFGDFTSHRLERVDSRQQMLSDTTREGLRSEGILTKSNRQCGPLEQEEFWMPRLSADGSPSM